MTRALLATTVLVALAGVAHAGPPAPAAAASATLHGTIVDEQGKPVGGATITVGDQLAASDDDGTFELALPPGRYTVIVSADWLEPSQTPVALAAGADLALTIHVKNAKQSGGEKIEVVGIAPTAPGETKVTAAFARAVPGGGDTAKIVQSLPAVARPSAGSTEIVVWGAAPKDTRVFVDGVPVPELYHVGGYRSAVGNDLIGDIHLSPAAFGVDRGGAIGGTIDIGLADPATAPTWRLQADVLDASAEAKVKLGAATLAAAVRDSWLDRAVGLIEDPSKLAPNAPLPRWGDAQVVLRAPLGDGLTLSAWAIGSMDHLRRALASDDPATETSELADQQMARAQVTVRRDRPDGYDSATLWLGHDATSDDLAFGLIPANLAKRAWVGGARGVQQRRLPSGPVVTLGVDVDGEIAQLQRYGSLSIPHREGDIYIFGQAPGDDVAADRWDATTIDAAGYGAVDLFHGPVAATLGLRLDTWVLTASRLLPRIGATPAFGSQRILMTPDPRGSLQYELTGALTARLDAGRYHEARDAADTSAVFGTPGLGVEEGWHVTLGAQWRHAPLALEVAGYARWLDDLVARDLALTPPLAQALTQLGVGRVAGVQVTARVLAWHHLSGWLSYDLSVSERKDAPDQAWRYFDHDQTHGLIAVAGWEAGPWSLGGRVRLATGEPRTPVLGAFFDSRTGRYEPIVGPHNGERLPTFFAADVRGERRFALGGARAAIYLELQNVTNRSNAEEIIYSADFTQKGYLTGLPLLAIAGLRIEK